VFVAERSHKPGKVEKHCLTWVRMTFEDNLFQHKPLLSKALDNESNSLEQFYPVFKTN